MNRMDRRSLRMYPLSDRKNKLDIREIAVSPDRSRSELPPSEMGRVQRAAQHIHFSRRHGRPVILTYGAHLIKNGIGPVVVRLIEEGWVTHLATNGAGSIHDWEFAYQAVSGEDVRANVTQGQFGTWEETGRSINLAIAVGGLESLGYGASVGKMIEQDGLQIPTADELRSIITVQTSKTQPDEILGAASDLLSLITTHNIQPGWMAIPHPYKSISVQCAAFQHGVPLTVHPGIGYDIIYTHPLNCGGAIGRAAVNDFLSFAESVHNLTGGVHLSVGSAIMAPMIFEKALSMANNLSLQTGPVLSDYYLVVNDIQPGGDWDWTQGEPPQDNPAYYLRFCKSFYRMGGELDYICLDNVDFLVALYQELSSVEPICCGKHRHGGES